MTPPRPTAKVRVRQETITYQPSDSVAVREDEELGRLWGCKPGTAHQWKLVVNHHAADVIRLRRERGAIEAAAAYALPIEAAMAHVPTTSKAELQADLADAREDACQALYREERTGENARRLLRARALERATSLDADREIAARHGITL